MNTICEGIVVSGEFTCEGCRRPIKAGERIGHVRSGISGTSWHRQCHAEAMLKMGDAYKPSEQRGMVRVGTKRERLIALRARVELGAVDADTVRAVMLALLDEALS